MTDETRKLFDAPWEADKFVYYHPSGIGEINIRVKSSKNGLVARYVTTTEAANRLARLPELYDALAETIEEHCDLCINYTGDKPKLLIEEILKFGCPAKSKTCHCAKKIELLRKVRDGK